jgi:hypothetical protein
MITGAVILLDNKQVFFALKAGNGFDNDKESGFEA